MFGEILKKLRLHKGLCTKRITAHCRCSINPIMLRPTSPAPWVALRNLLKGRFIRKTAINLQGV